MLLRVVVVYNKAIGNMGDKGRGHQTSLSAFCNQPVSLIERFVYKKISPALGSLSSMGIAPFL